MVITLLCSFLFSLTPKGLSPFFSQKTPQTYHFWLKKCK
jgi:hypothetical protein